MKTSKIIVLSIIYSIIVIYTSNWVFNHLTPPGSIPEWVSTWAMVSIVGGLILYMIADSRDLALVVTCITIIYIVVREMEV